MVRLTGEVATTLDTAIIFAFGSAQLHAQPRALAKVCGANVADGTWRGKVLIL